MSRAYASASEIRRLLAERERTGSTPVWEHAPAPEPPPVTRTPGTAWTFTGFADAHQLGTLPTGAALDQAIIDVAGDVDLTDPKRAFADAGDILVELGALPGYSPWLASDGLEICARQPDPKHPGTPGNITLCGKQISGRVLSLPEPRGGSCDWLVDLKLLDWHDRNRGSRCGACANRVARSTLPDEIATTAPPRGLTRRSCASTRACADPPRGRCCASSSPPVNSTRKPPGTHATGGPTAPVPAAVRILGR